MDSETPTKIKDTYSFLGIRERNEGKKKKALMINVAPDIAVALKINLWKEMDFWHPILWWENVSFKESPPSITVTRNPN